jgi:hypothetical protein
MKKIKLLFLCLLPMLTYSQNYKTVKVVSSPNYNQSDDTLYVRLLNPEGLDSVIKNEQELLTYFYKPYCRGITDEKYNGLSPMDTVIRYCLRTKIPFAFIAVDDLDIERIHENFINKYQLKGVLCYLIDRSFGTNKFDRVIMRSGKKNKRTCHYYRKGHLYRSSYSYNFNLTEFIEFRNNLKN